MLKLEDVRRAKDLAARKAFEAYAECLQTELGEEGLIEALDATAHEHEALLMLKDSKPLAVKCRWDFSAHPAVIVAAVERLKEKMAEVEELAKR